MIAAHSPGRPAPAVAGAPLPASLPLCLRAALLAALAACSRGGGGAAPPVLPPGPMLPELSVASITPMPGAVVSPIAVLAVGFAEEIDVATLQPDEFTVRDAVGELLGAHFYSEPLRVWVLVGRDEWPRGSVLRARVGTAVRGVRGSALPRDLEWEFAVAPGTLQPPVPLGPGVPGHPPFATLRGGLAVLGHERTAYERMQSGHVVAVPLPLDLRGMHLDAAGGLAALCTAATFGAEVSVVRRRPDGTWQPPRALLVPPRFGRLEQLHGNARGDLVARCYGLLGTVPGTEVETVLRASWDAPETWLPLDVGPPSVVREMAVDGVGGLWHAVPDPAGLTLRRIGPGGEPLEVPVAGAGAELLQLAAFGNGGCLAIYGTGSGAGARLRARRYEPLGGLGPEVVIADLPATLEDFALGAGGRGLLAFAVDGGAELWTATVDLAGGGWGQPQPQLAATLPFRDGSRAAVAVSPRGAGWLTAVRPWTAGAELVLLSAAGGDPERLDAVPAGGSFVRPAMASDPGNRLGVFWLAQPEAPSGPVLRRYAEVH